MNYMKNATLTFLTVFFFWAAAQPVRSDQTQKNGQANGVEERKLAVIVHPDNAIKNLSTDLLRDIFLRRQTTWPNGRKIAIINWSPRSQTRTFFDRTVLNMSPDQVSSYWIDQRIRGQGQPPRSVSSALFIKAIVARHKDAISYIPVSEVNGHVKVVKIEGRLPENGQYLLSVKHKKKNCPRQK